MSQNENEIMESQSMEEVTIDGIFGNNGAGEYFSSDGVAKSFEGQAKDLEQLDGETTQLGDLVNKTIKITKFLATPVKLVDQNTHEKIDRVRIILVTDQGLLSTASPSVGQRLAQYNNLFKFNNLQISEETPLVVTVKQQSTRNGFKVLTLMLDTPSMKGYTAEK